TLVLLLLLLLALLLLLLMLLLLLLPHRMLLLCLLWGVQNAPWLSANGSSALAVACCSSTGAAAATAPAAAPAAAPAGDGGALPVSCIPTRPLIACAAEASLRRRVACLCLWLASDMISSIDMSLRLDIFEGELGRPSGGPF